MYKGLDHARFADVMDANLGNVLISYNDHPRLSHGLMSGTSMTGITPNNEVYW